MKQMIFLVGLFILTLALSGCNIVSSDEAIFSKYCEEFPNDEGCIIDGNPSGVIIIDSMSCSEGYILQDNACVTLNDVPSDILNCDSGQHKEDELCVPDEVDVICEEDLILNNGSCVSSCELSIEDINYFPCFSECNIEFPCTHLKLVLAEENSFFSSFVMWVQSTEMNGSTEFELHYVLSGETESVISNGGTKLWCSPHMVGCEDLYKANFFITNTTGERSYIFEFWYDANWYTKVHKIRYDVWNAETNEYDSIDAGILAFYLENTFGTD